MRLFLFASDHVYYYNLQSRLSGQFRDTSMDYIGMKKSRRLNPKRTSFRLGYHILTQTHMFYYYPSFLSDKGSIRCMYTYVDRQIWNPFNSFDAISTSRTCYLPFKLKEIKLMFKT